MMDLDMVVWLNNYGWTIGTENTVDNRKCNVGRRGLGYDIFIRAVDSAKASQLPALRKDAKPGVH